jgi:hypothetical protein
MRSLLTNAAQPTEGFNICDTWQLDQTVQQNYCRQKYIVPSWANSSKPPKNKNSVQGMSSKDLNWL